MHGITRRGEVITKKHSVTQYEHHNSYRPYSLRGKTVNGSHKTSTDAGKTLACVNVSDSDDSKVKLWKSTDGFETIEEIATIDKPNSSGYHVHVIVDNDGYIHVCVQKSGNSEFEHYCYGPDNSIKVNRSSVSMLNSGGVGATCLSDGKIAVGAAIFNVDPDTKELSDSGLGSQHIYSVDSDDQNIVIKNNGLHVYDAENEVLTHQAVTTNITNDASGYHRGFCKTKEGNFYLFSPDLSFQKEFRDKIKKVRGSHNLVFGHCTFSHHPSTSHSTTNHGAVMTNMFDWVGGMEKLGKVAKIIDENTLLVNVSSDSVYDSGPEEIKIAEGVYFHVKHDETKPDFNLDDTKPSDYTVVTTASQVSCTEVIGGKVYKDIDGFWYSEYVESNLSLYMLIGGFCTFKNDSISGDYGSGIAHLVDATRFPSVGLYFDGESFDMLGGHK